MGLLLRTHPEGAIISEKEIKVLNKVANMHDLATSFGVGCGRQKWKHGRQVF